MNDSPTTHDLYAYEPPLSLWDLVIQHIPSHETEEIKNVLGEYLVDQSLELHVEVQTLLEIWREYRDETQQSLMHSRLSEPPAARDRLKQEIKFLVDSLHEKAKDEGRNVGEVLSKHKTEIINYVREDKAGGEGTSRPGTARSNRDGRETPMQRGGSDRLSSHASSVEDVESLNDKLNLLRLDEVVDHLRITLKEEVALLMGDIEFLQKCLDEEADFRCQSRLFDEPSLTELRQERSLLEKDLLTPDPSIHSLMKSQTPKSSATIRPLDRPGSGRMRTPPSTFGSRITPLKADHTLNPSTQVLTFQGPGHHHDQSHSKSLRQKSSAPPKPSPKTLSRTDNLHATSRLRNACSGKDASSGHSHITIRTEMGVLPPNARIVKVGSIPVAGADAMATHVPSPPSSAKPELATRPSSAQRFRRMVVQCRDGT